MGMLSPSSPHRSPVVPLLLVASLALPCSVSAGTFDAWGLVFAPLEMSFATCTSLDVTSLTCDQPFYDLEPGEPIVLWLVADHAAGFYSNGIAEIGARLFMSPIDAMPPWTSCGWMDVVVPDASYWRRTFTHVVSENRNDLLRRHFRGR